MSVVSRKPAKLASPFVREERCIRASDRMAHCVFGRLDLLKTEGSTSTQVLIEYALNMIAVRGTNQRRCELHYQHH